VEGLSQE